MRFDRISSYSLVSLAKLMNLAKIYLVFAAIAVNQTKYHSKRLRILLQGYLISISITRAHVHKVLINAWLLRRLYISSSSIWLVLLNKRVDTTVGDAVTQQYYKSIVRYRILMNIIDPFVVFYINDGNGSTTYFRKSSLL